MKKGIGPQGLGAPKSAAKMYNSPAKKDKPGKKLKSKSTIGTSEEIAQEDQLERAVRAGGGLQTDRPKKEYPQSNLTRYNR